MSDWAPPGLGHNGGPSFAEAERWYQTEAIESVFSYFLTNTGNPIVALPTGTGKSHIISGFVRRALYRYPNTRIMMLTHVKELIEQNAAKLRSAWPSAPLGIFSASIGQKDYLLPIIFGGVASVKNAVELFGHIDLLFVDECHLISPKDESMYQHIIKMLKLRNPYLKVIGLTATPWRMKQGLLTEGGIFTDFCFDMTDMQGFNRFVAEGWLCRVRARPTQGGVADISEVGIVGGEFNQTQLAKAVDKPELTFAAVRETVETMRREGRRSCIAFGDSIEHAEHINEMFGRFGVASSVVHSKLHSTENDKRIAAYQAGELEVLVNKDKLTTGFDDPKTDTIMMDRHVISPGLWVQMLGRGTRPLWPRGFNPNRATIEERLWCIENSPKRDCLVLDFARNAERLGPINDPKIPRSKKSKGLGDVPVKICEKDKTISGKCCGEYNHAAARFCEWCHEEFIFRPKIEGSADHSAEVLREEFPIIETFDVGRVLYAAKESRQNGIPMLVASYMIFNPTRVFRHNILLEHNGLAKHRAHEWWRQHHHLEPPDTVEQALTVERELRVPRRIRVHTNTKYPEVQGYEF